MATQRVMGAKEWAMLLILSVLWGGSFFFIGVAVKELPPLTIMMLRVGCAALTLHLVIRVMGQWMPRDPKVWLAFCGMGLLNNVIPANIDCLGANANTKRACLHSECNDATFWGSCCPFFYA